MKILIVEDEARMASAVYELLTRDNYSVDVENDGIGGRDALLTGIYDVAVLDVMLPGMNGFDIVKEARAHKIITPILMLTARTEWQDKVRGLDSGADDYLTKPFQVEELKARIRALTRRGAGTAATADTASFGDLELNLKNCTLACSSTGRDIRLPEKEFHIMEYLMANAGQIVSKEQLTLKVWGYESDAEYNNAEVYVSFIRKKLKFLGSGTEIKAARGLGYELKQTE